MSYRVTYGVAATAFFVLACLTVATAVGTFFWWLWHLDAESVIRIIACGMASCVAIALHVMFHELAQGER